MARPLDIVNPQGLIGVVQPAAEGVAVQGRGSPVDDAYRHGAGLNEEINGGDRPAVPIEEIDFQASGPGCGFGRGAG